MLVAGKTPAPSAQPAPPQPAPPVKPTPTPTHQWACTLHGLDTDELPAKITVGDKLRLDCEGPPAKLSAAKLEIALSENQTYALHLLESKSLSETKATLIVTPWRAGEWKVSNPALTDGTLRIGLGDQEYTVTTVLDAKTNPEGKPFPPMHPLTLAWPLWLWLFVAAIGVGVLYLVGLAVRKSLRRKRLLATLEKNATALSPVNHFNKELRRLQRQIPLDGAPWSVDESRAFFKDLDGQFRWFLARELVIPALDGSTSSILKDTKTSSPEVFKTSSRDLRVALLELRKAVGASTAQSGEDALQLMDLARKVADRIAKERNV